MESAKKLIEVFCRITELGISLCKITRGCGSGISAPGISQ